MKQRVVALLRSAVAWMRGHPIAPGSRKGLVVGLVLFALLAAGSGTAVAVDRITAVPAGAVARVNGKVITEEYLDQQAKMMTTMSGQPAPTDKTLLAKDAVLKQVLEDVATERNIVIADKTANDKLTELLQRSYPQGREQFLAMLAKAGVPEPVVVQGIKRTMLVRQLFDQITKDVVPPTDQDVAQTYESRKAELTVPERRHVRNIAVATKEQADQVRARLDRGEDFATVAKEASIDTETKDQGGELGVATRDAIADKPFGDAVFAAPANSVFGPVQTQSQVWAVGQVLEVTPPNLPPLEQVRDAVRAQLFQLRKLDRFNHWVSEQLSDANVRYADQYRPADPTGLPGMPPDLPAGPR